MPDTTFIQWKGTDVCMDWTCACGLRHHIDGSWCYYLKCGNCGLVYKVGTSVTLTLTDPSDPDIEPGPIVCTAGEER